MHLDDIILNNGLENVKIASTEGVPLEGTVLVNIIKNLLRMEKILDLFEVKNMERMVLKSFAAEGLSQNMLGDMDQTTEIVELVLRRIEKRYPELMPVTIDIEKDEEESKYRIDVKSRRNGLERRTVIDYDLTESPSFEEIVSINRKIEAVGEPPFRLEIEDKVEEISSFSGLVGMIMEHGRKKLAIQRYKGLGEMNAGPVVGNDDASGESPNTSSSRGGRCKS